MAKLEGFGYMFLNVIQVVFAYFDEKGPTGRTEEAIWNAWQGTAADLVNSSSVVRRILTCQGADQVFNAHFLRG